MGFRLGKYDRRLPLTIDPELAYVRKFGGSNSDLTRAIALDPQGNIYVADQSNSADFPTTSGTLQPRLTSPLRVFSNAGRTISPSQLGPANSVGAVGGTKDGRIIYASTADGILLSGDGGATWRTTAPLPVPGIFSASLAIMAEAIAVDSLDPATLLVATRAGLFGSTDGGRSWYPRHTGLPVSASGYVSVSNVFYDPANPLIAYTTTNNPSYVFKSIDAGGTWLPLNPTYSGEALPPAAPFRQLAAALSPGGSALYSVNGNGTLLKSLDAGTTWTGLARSTFYSPIKIEFDSANPNTIYVLDAVNLRKSTDGGATFSMITTPVGPRRFAIDASGALYVADFERLTISADGGATFTAQTGVSYSINAQGSWMPRGGYRLYSAARRFPSITFRRR